MNGYFEDDDFEERDAVRAMNGYFAFAYDDDLEERLSEQTELPPEEASNVVTAEKMRGTISRWVRNTVSHHTMRLGEGILPPMFPFLLTFDPRKRIFAICFANILCVDIDEKQGIDKEKAAELVQKYAESHGLTFRLYETDRGMHAYCTSKTFDFREEETWDIMHEMKCDLHYIAFSANRGFCLRLSPKLFDDSSQDLALGIPKTEEDFNKEFVQREWCQKIVGSTREDPALVSMINFMMQLTGYIKKTRNLRAKVCNNLEWDALISDISTYAKKEYQKLFEQQGQIQLALRKWLVSQSTHALPYLNDPKQWTPCKNPKHLRTKHPVDGKPIVVFERTKDSKYKSGWCFVHDNKFEGPFRSRRQARRAAEKVFGELLPKNVEMALKPSALRVHWTAQMLRKGVPVLRCLFCCWVLMASLFTLSAFTMVQTEAALGDVECQECRCMETNSIGPRCTLLH